METVASVENLGDLASSVDSCCQGAADCVAETSVELERLNDAADANLSSATQALEEARGEVARLQQRIDSLQQSLDSADEESRDDISNDLSAAEADLDQANEVLAQREERHEKAAGAVRKAGELRERFLQASRTSMNRLAGLEQDCVARLNRACEALERYAAEHPTSTTAMFNNWISWKPGKSDLVSPGTLAARLHLSPPLLQKMAEYEAERDPHFRTKLEEYGKKWSTAGSLGERKRLLTQARINLSGEFSERIVKAAFRPLGDVSTQCRTYFDDGRYTKTDLMVRNLRAPVVLGRGDRSFAPKGGSLALEVKAGKADYLYAQGNHMEFQAGGHRSANASATICTADIHDMSEDAERGLRDRMRDAGSPMLAMLPRKSDIDHAIYEAIAYGIGKDRA